MYRRTLCHVRNIPLPQSMTAVLLVILFLCSGCILLKKKFNQSVNPPTGTIPVAGVLDEIVIRRDSLGVPYIEARNEDDHDGRDCECCK